MIQGASRSSVAPGARRRRLILLTGNYPYTGGDNPFVQAEINHLATEFDELVVSNFNNPPAGSTHSPLPANCTYLGGSVHRSLFAVARGMLSFSRLRTLWSAIRLGVKSHESQVVADLRAAVIGMAIAANPKLRTLVNDASAEVSVYAFWGTGASYALPWLDELAASAVRLHGSDLYDDKAGYRPLRPAVFRASTALLTISEHGRAYLNARHPEVPSQNVLVRRLGVFPGPPNPSSNDSVVRIVSCSSVIPLKRVDKILDVVSALAATGREVEWTHFGGGPLLESLAKAADAAGHTHPTLRIDLRGWTPHSDILAHYRSHAVSLIVNMSTTEGIPVSLIEAAARGIPIVATDVGGTSELVGEALESGLLVSADAPTADVLVAIEQIIDGTIQVSPRKVWRERFDADQNGRESARTLRSLARAESLRGSWAL